MPIKQITTEGGKKKKKAKIDWRIDENPIYKRGESDQLWADSEHFWGKGCVHVINITDVLCRFPDVYTLCIDKTLSVTEWSWKHSAVVENPH